MPIVGIGLHVFIALLCAVHALRSGQTVSVAAKALGPQQELRCSVGSTQNIGLSQTQEPS